MTEAQKDAIQWPNIHLDEERAEVKEASYVLTVDMASKFWTMRFDTAANATCLFLWHLPVHLELLSFWVLKLPHLHKATSNAVTGRDLIYLDDILTRRQTWDQEPAL